MYQHRFWNLLAKKLSGEATEEEISELTQLLKENPDLSFAAQNLADLWKIKPVENNTAAEDAFQKLFGAMDDKPAENQVTDSLAFDLQPPSKKKWWLSFAILLVAAVGVFFFLQNSRPDTLATTASTQVQEVLTRPGTRTKLVLPDSTVVWLNAGSKLTYNQPFGVADRSVTLTGEAYFDVAKKNIPFLIHTNGALIKVLGTAFNVRSYTAEAKIETSLVHGRVEVSLDKDPEDKFYLKPNQKLTLNMAPATGQKKRKKDQLPLAVYSELRYLDENIIAETSWVENKLVFDDESFEEVARKMEHWYGVTITFKNEKIKAERLTGIFEKEPVWQALKILQEIAAFQFTMKDDQITITN